MFWWHALDFIAKELVSGLYYVPRDDMNEAECQKEIHRTQSSRLSVKIAVFRWWYS